MRAQHARVALLLMLLPLLAADKPKTDLFDEIYQRSLPQVSTLKTIRARFTETTTSSLLATPLVAEGTLVAVRPSDLLITYTKPDRKILRMDARRLLFLWPDRHVRQESDIEQAQKRVQHYFVDKSPDELRKHFTIHATEDPQKPGMYLVDLVPTRKQIKEGVSRIELWIDKSSLMLATMRLTFPNGDTKTMALHDVELNGPVDLSSLEKEEACSNSKRPTFTKMGRTIGSRDQATYPTTLTPRLAAQRRVSPLSVPFSDPGARHSLPDARPFLPDLPVFALYSYTP